MHTILIDDDIYSYLLKNTKEIGESASDILRRLLSIPKTAATSSEPSEEPLVEHELMAVISGPNFVAQKTAVRRFLLILQAVYKQNKDDFEKVLVIQGRDRKYFACSSEEIKNSGSATQPKEIPGSPYWVMTNSPTWQKKEMLRQVLGLLAYSNAAITAATATLK
jgi:negative modulator of initiation of replication